MNALTDLLHLLLCRIPHATDMMEIVDRKEGRCYYYLENDIAGGDLMPDHLRWKDITQKFKASLGFRSDQEALDFAKRGIEIAQQINKLCDGNEKKKEFIKSILC